MDGQDPTVTSTLMTVHKPLASMEQLVLIKWVPSDVNVLQERLVFSVNLMMPVLPILAKQKELLVTLLLLMEPFLVVVLRDTKEMIVPKTLMSVQQTMKGLDLQWFLLEIGTWITVCFTYQEVMLLLCLPVKMKESASTQLDPSGVIVLLDSQDLDVNRTSTNASPILVKTQEHVLTKQDTLDVHVCLASQEVCVKLMLMSVNLLPV